MYQQQLSEFLELELHHSLGAYARAADQLEALEREIGETNGSDESCEYLGKLAGMMAEYNRALDRDYDAALESAPKAATTRHPSPERLPLSNPANLKEDRPADSTQDGEFTWVIDFYRAAVEALGPEKKAKSLELGILRTALLASRKSVANNRGDEQREVVWRPARKKNEESRKGGRPERTRAARAADRRGRKRARFRARIERAEMAGIPSQSLNALGDKGVASPSTNVVATVVGSWLGAEHRRKLTPFVVQALVDAHLTMHEVESYWSRPLGNQLERRLPQKGDTPPSQRAERLLRRSIEMNTFVWAAARTAPWMFAESEAERSHIEKSYERAWRTSMPIRPMWISAQVSLLALHRRAYAHALLGETVEAFRDYMKLQRHVRDTSRRLEEASVYVKGSQQFLRGLDALADCHIGDLYRADRDFVSAVDYFTRAEQGLRRFGTERGESVLTNSRWFVRLQLSLGKSCYELGRHKAALAWYLRTWKALVTTMADETGAEVDTSAADGALHWLDRVEPDPELHKTDVFDHLEPVVSQIADLRIDPRFTALASDVLVRIGHLLFMLNLEDEHPGTRKRQVQSRGRRRTWRESAALARLCLRRAHQLDEANTLAMTDLLNLRFREIRSELSRRDGDDVDPRGPNHSVKNAGEISLPPQFKDIDFRNLTDIALQWPGRADSVEALSRAFEYLMLQELRNTQEADLSPSKRGSSPKKKDTTSKLARELLHSLLSHTDSIEARRSQVHSFLTRSPQPPIEGTEPRMEFVCLRRYSSAFPMLPRPQAFRSFGGGYFLRFSSGLGAEARSFGIAIDPGNSYIECLYRAGFSVADIDMVLMTHDHVDHALSFEPLLSLRHEMHTVDPTTQRPLLVAGNKSVLRRWKSFGPGTEKAPIEFYSLAKKGHRKALNRKIRRRAHLKSNQFRLRPLDSALLGNNKPGPPGHLDRKGNPSIGALIEVGSSKSRKSIAIASDLPKVSRKQKWPGQWKRALAADVFIAHVSTVPLSELRHMAALGYRDAKKRDARDLKRQIAWANEQYHRYPDAEARLGYAGWLSIRGQQFNPVGPLPRWKRPRGHIYAEGLVDLARSFATADPGGRARILLLGELSEELGSFRGKLAIEINRRLFVKDSGCRAVTADLGLRIVLDTGRPEARVMCSTCELDNDLAAPERLHAPDEIGEICIKGENEGVFYYCQDHHPTLETEDPMFFERHERYDVFGR